MIERSRDSNCLAIIGTNNTGKTVIAEQLIIKFNKKRDLMLKREGYPSNYLKLFVFDPQHRFQKYMRKGDVNININSEGWEGAILKCRDSLCVFDDVKLLLDNDRLSKPQKAILAFRAEYGLDLVFIVWHPLDLPPKLSKFIDKYYLFKCHGEDKDFIARINGSKPDILNCKRLVDKEFLKYNKQTYKELFPNFFFVFYDTGTNTSVKVNF